MSYELTEDDWAHINDPAIQEQLKRKAAELDAKYGPFKSYDEMTEKEREENIKQIKHTTAKLKLIMGNYGSN